MELWKYQYCVSCKQFALGFHIDCQNPFFRRFYLLWHNTLLSNSTKLLLHYNFFTIQYYIISILSKLKSILIVTSYVKHNVHLLAVGSPLDVSNIICINIIDVNTLMSLSFFEKIYGLIKLNLNISKVNKKSAWFKGRWLFNCIKYDFLDLTNHILSFFLLCNKLKFSTSMINIILKLVAFNVNIFNVLGITEVCSISLHIS